MLRILDRLPATIAFLLYVATVPLALSSDGQPEDEAEASTAPTAETEKLTPAASPDASEAKSDAQPAVADTVNDGPATDSEKWVCRKETPTGSHRTITACRRAADIEADSAEVEKVFSRQRHYGNPSVTPEG